MTLKSWVQPPHVDTFFHEPFIRIKPLKTKWPTWHCCMRCNSENCRVDFMMVDKAMNAVWVDTCRIMEWNGRGKSSKEESAKRTELSLYSCKSTDLHRQVHRPLFTGCRSRLGSQGQCQVYQSLFTDSPLQITSYWKMAKQKQKLFRHSNIFGLYQS